MYQSRPLDSTWDFGPAISLFASDWTTQGPPTPLSPPPIGKPSRNDGSTEELTVKLGSFNRLFQELGMSIEDSLPHTPLPPDPVIDEPLTSDDALYSPVDDNVDNTDGRDSYDEESGNALQDPFSGMTKKQRKRARRQAERARKIDYPKYGRGSLAEEEKEREKERARLEQVSQIQANGDAMLAQAGARSNVGAKMRPSTPAQALPSTPIKPTTKSTLQRHKTDTPATLRLPQSNLPLRSFSYNCEQSCESTAHNHATTNDGTSGNVYHNAGLPTNSYSQSTLTSLNFTLSNQYTTAGSQVPYHHQLPNGFLTTIRGWPGSFTPSPIPRVNNQVPLGVVTPGPATHPSLSKTTTNVVPRSREDRDYDFLNHLITSFPEDKKWLVSPMRLTNDKSSPAGLHVFVDASNILIGFKEVMKRIGGTARDMSFDCLALLLERRRPVSKRVYASSTRLNAPIASVEKFNELAGEVGYEKNIYEQVFKSKEQTESQKFFKDVDRVGWVKATQLRSGSGGSGSDSETGAAPSLPRPAPKWVEQGVDESLHLKMCQSIIDAEAPSTMVLATGDGAVAEYSDGFLAHVERALKKGWKVELVSWKQQTSSGYKNRRFRQKWGDQFKIIELDNFLEYMSDE
ncbi:hypothetical protein BU24DRAFT_375762 [Aaosphaeria arxii CBS 175.79]|uniref:NYN domain-containing protein n=1 Tax=Aaosphaeria arxii CBS 175.79 TaxID=1450172 RepID=A0A6A5XH79_9PLEO|nr:uncharacterized protein BU24DRAFT_375762 [Aaosphaeria arxii CBS 175.79]KAF2012197.1 hypothetical protein BU24DRAFT_375762 [Aaosphaeria arxii CBS 175.79]